MRRRLAIPLALAASLTAAKADIAPPPPELVDVAAGDLIFLIVTRDYAPPSHPTAQLIGCADGKPNCVLARDRGLIGKRVVGFDGKRFDAGRALRGQIVAAFQDQGAAGGIEVDFEPETGDAPLPVSFARR